MRDPKRIKRITDKLEYAWSKVPDWRLGQFIQNISPRGSTSDPFHVEDEDWEKAIDWFLMAENLGEDK